MTFTATSTEAAPSAATIDCLTKLISFDTTSRNSNLALIEWAANRLEDAGATLRYDYNAERNKANLFATFGAGPGGVVLSGHTDVVPVDGQQWSSDPFTAQIRDGRLYGRGACDMKAYLGVVLAQTERFAQASARLREPLHIALSYDEELGCLGIGSLVADMQRAGIEPSGCIAGEPTSMRLVTAHKGARLYRCQIRGCAAHSSLTPRGVNAIEYAARIITQIQDLAEREAARGLQNANFDVPFSTLSTNMVQGGRALNIVPAECEFTFEYRYLPGVSPAHFIDQIEDYANGTVLPKMRARNPNSAIEFECIGEVHALDANEAEEMQRLAEALLGRNALPGDGHSGAVGYGTEAGFFQHAGVPSIVCGPGSIEQAHKPDEYVSLAQLAICERFVAGIVDRMTLA